MCRVDNATYTTWAVTPSGGVKDCVLRHNKQNENDTCGPGGVFNASLTDQSGDNYTSILRVESISDGLNDTRVKCEDPFRMDVGMETICIIGKLFIRTCCDCGAGGSWAYYIQM